VRDTSYFYLLHCIETGITMWIRMTIADIIKMAYLYNCLVHQLILEDRCKNSCHSH